MRVMAIDYGDARTGVAVSDAAGLLAGYTAVIHQRKPEAVAEEINEILLHKLRNNIRFCARCGKALALHHRGRLCDACFRRERKGAPRGSRPS